MKHSVQQKRVPLSVAAIACSLLLLCCTSTQPVPRSAQKSVPAPEVSQSNIVLPEGWTDITFKSNNPSVLLWIVNQDYSASMVLREFQADDSTKKILLKEDACFMANISLRLKLADDSVQRRITRTPETVSKLSNSCTYVYDENGLLRRVIVFNKQNRMYELELLQENSSKPFEELTADQISMIRILQR